MDELESLIVSGTELDRKLVATVLAPYVRLDHDNNAIRPEEKWRGLKVDQKVLVVLLSHKAMAALGFDIPDEAMAPKEVVFESGLKPGTVNPALRRMLDDRLVAQADNRRYFIPNHAIRKVADMLQVSE